MADRTKSMTKRTYWRSLDELAGTREFRTQLSREFPQGAEELEVNGLNRRQFVGLLGASAALAGVGAVGCVRKPTQYIMPYVRTPEDTVPGVPKYYATSFAVAGTVGSFLVRSTDGRPTKIEGNPSHPGSRGATDVWSQAAVLGVYDPDRSQSPVHGGAATDWAAADAALADARTALAANGGAGAGFVFGEYHSPTFSGQLRALKSAYPAAKFYRHDLLARPNEKAALAQVVPGTAARVSYRLENADVIVALDADPLGSGGDQVANARGFAAGRQVEDEHSAMNRLYAVEPAFTVTGATADHRLQVAASQVGEFAKALAAYLASKGRTASGLGAVSGAGFDAWIAAVGDDLIAHAGRGVVMVGDRQPAWVHALGFAINEALENVGSTVVFRADTDAVEAGDLAALKADVGSLQTLFVIGANPAYTGEADLELAAAISAVASTYHLGYHVDETGKLCGWHFPEAHGLEAWGDARTTDGVAGLQQPLIEPLYPAVSAIEFVARLLPGEMTSGYEVVRAHWAAEYAAHTLVGRFDDVWATWLHQGVIAELGTPAAVATRDYSAVAGTIPAAVAAPTAQALEVVFALDNKVMDGRYANNAWLQELPDPITKLTWDNAALIGVATARALGINFSSTQDEPILVSAQQGLDVPYTPAGQLNTQIVRLDVGGRSLEVAVMVTAGVAENVVLLPLGYGRAFGGRVADGVGFNTYTLRTTTTPWIATGATMTKTAAPYVLATTQDHNTVEGRHLAVEASLEEYRNDPEFVVRGELMAEDKLNSLWEEPNARDGQQWGMSIDLSTCTGCNACTIACQAENNISVVGKERVLMGREMAWIRLDRYYSGDVNNPQAFMQPVACAHCETAPCEQVCPVAATIHGAEGTNDMVYNRCIGTRYCANNCPYKVRRYNFFNFARENDAANPLLRLGKNPNVTVRFRGVMEKCSYCVQRVNEAKVEARVAGHNTVADGAITPACGQVCPTQSIVFGDINDPNSRVSRMKRRNRDYAMLAWLNIHPRTTYLAKVRNPNPALASV